MLPITISLLYRALPKANLHKIAKYGSGSTARRRVVNDLTGCVAQSERSFALQALATVCPNDRAEIPWSCPIEAKVTFVYKPSQSWPKWKRSAALHGSLLFVKTPDLENVAKFVFDALEAKKGRPGFYTDDKLIFRQILEKKYGPEERVIVTLTPYPQATAANWENP